MKLFLPALFYIDLKEAGSTIQQLAIPAWTGEVAVEPIDYRRIHGYKFTKQEQDDQTVIYLITNTAPPDPTWTHVIRKKGLDFDHTATASLDLSDTQWTKHPQATPNFNNLADYEANVEQIRASWLDAFTYKRENQASGIVGLRPPQIGAIYAVQAHWTVNTDLATIVLPTGVGKTETMLSLLVAERCQRLLVVVPTDALRTQIAEKFLSLGLLKTRKFGVISTTAMYPVVGILNHRPKSVEQANSIFRKCNVIVTTMPLAGQCERAITQRMAELCSCLFIDEAHHVAAQTWKDFKAAFDKSKIVQFTATPYRNDNQQIGGKRIFTFSLKQAQEQNYFKKINFKPVTEWDITQRDKSIAKAAVEQLRADAHLGHILMARVSNIRRAEEVFECYQEYTEFEPVQIHTGIKSKAERDEIRQKLISGSSRIVVCVDMLGEGFDLPELKIAALHDVRKSLAVTLQLIGRFTRTKPNLGDATVITNIADPEVKSELKRLYQHDSDWNALLPLLNDKVSDGDFNLGEYLGGFQDLPEEITLQNVRPAMSTVAYRTTCDEWTPENFSNGISGFNNLDKVYHTINSQDNTLVIVTTKRISVNWAQIDEIHNWDWQLYVVHWEKADGLLFIHNSSNSGFFKDLARAVAGNDVEQISGPKIFRCLASVGRLKLQNVGLLEQLGRLIRYTMRAGSDVEPGLSEAQKQKARKANIFGQGFENGHRSSRGCSYKGRIWSARTTNLLQLVNWCRDVGKKLIDETIDPEKVLAGTLVPKIVSERPTQVPIGIEWPDFFFKDPERTISFEIDGNKFYLNEVDIDLVDPKNTGPLQFTISSEIASAKFELIFIDADGHPDYKIQALQTEPTTIQHNGRKEALTDFFEEHSPTFWFANGSSLCGIEYVSLPTQPQPFPLQRIEDWDWTGTLLHVESQKIARNPQSIQYRVIQEMKKRPFTVIFDDDDSGEAADVVGITEQDNSIDIEFWHCKFIKEDLKPGARVDDLYQLCGQAQKSVRWTEKPRDLVTHLMSREPRRFLGNTGTRYEIGTEQDLLRIREKVEAQVINFKIFIVQPGVAKSKISPEQLELLAVTESYLLNFLASFAVVSNK